jgi:hypothetical protein
MRSYQLQQRLAVTVHRPFDRCRQIWNIGRAHDRRRTVLDDVPTPTDLKLETRVAVQRSAAPSTEDRPSTQGAGVLTVRRDPVTGRGGFGIPG